MYACADMRTNNRKQQEALTFVYNHIVPVQTLLCLPICQRWCKKSVFVVGFFVVVVVVVVAVVCL